MNQSMAPIDPLTGALARAGFDDQVRQTLLETARSLQETSLLLLDLDHFKSINDAFGHARGDQVLAELVQRVQALSRGSDRVFRFGGDEFLVLLPDTNAEQAMLLAERLVVAVRSVPFAGDPPLSLSVSIGFATALPGEHRPEDLFARADQHLYAAKRGGRGRVAGHDRIETHGEGRLLEREAASHEFRQFLNALPHYRRGGLLVSGERGAGQTSFLRESERVAQLLGYKTIVLTGRSAYATHPYGALLDGLDLEMGLLAVAGDADALLNRLTASGERLLWLLDRMEWIDPASLNTLRRLLETNTDPAMGVIVAGTETQQAETWLGGLVRHRIELAPLSRAASQVLARSFLRWEPPTSLITWLWQQSGGLPGQVVATLEALRRHGGLIRGADGYVLMPDFAIRMANPVEAPEPEQLLPRPGKSLVGRDRELADLKALLRERRLVSLIGQGGLGKTHLAMQLALEVNHRYRNGAVFIPLASLNDPTELMPRIAQEFGLKPTGDALAAVQSVLVQRDLLLVLDNFEHLLDAAPALSRLLQAAPGLNILITSRERLRLPEEWVLELDGLDVPTDGTNPEQSGAVRLLLQAARRVDPGLRLEDADLNATRRICRLVGGMPLGLELAAAWVRVLSFQEIAQEIEGNLGFLQLPITDTTQPERHRSLGAAFESSWGFLDAHQQRVLARLALFRGGFGREAASRVAGASVSALLAFINVSLLQRDPQHQGRYLMHELLRQFAIGKLQEDPDEAHQAHLDHATYHLEFAEITEPKLRGPDQALWLERVAVELDNLRMALRTFQHESDAESGLRLSTALEWFFYTRGLFHECIAWLGAFLEYDTNLTDVVRARALSALGSLEKEIGLVAQCRAHVQESLQLFRAVNDAHGAGHALRLLGLLERESGNHQRAGEYLTESLALHREIKDLWAIGATLNDLGIVHAYLDDDEHAAASFRESLEIKRQIGDLQGIAYAIGNLAGFLETPEERLAAEEESLAIKRQLNDRQGIANSLSRLGDIHEQQGNQVLSEACSIESLALLLEIGREYKVAQILLTCARRALDRQQFAVALHLAASIACWQHNSETKLPPHSARMLERVSSSAREALGANADTVWNDGYSFGLEVVARRFIADSRPA
jgi:diguanylate cyclase (GGDEF)-like protein